MLLMWFICDASVKMSCKELQLFSFSRKFTYDQISLLDNVQIVRSASVTKLSMRLIVYAQHNSKNRLFIGAALFNPVRLIVLKILGCLGLLQILYEL